MATALYTAPLASTPPVSTPRMAGGAGRRSTVVSFTRSGTSEDAVGSWRGGSSSFAESYGVPFSRSLTRSRTPETGSLHSLQQRAAQPRPVAPGVHRQASIPKSASFVRQEGFATRSDTPLSSPPASPQPRAVSSLLSRQLSTDGAGLPGFAFDDPLAAIQRLEQSLRLSPAAQPAWPSRTDLVPAELLEALQSQYDVFTEPEVVRAFSIAHAAHDGRYRESGDPAFLHCVEVARILAGLGVDEVTVAAALLHDALDDQLLPEAQLEHMLGGDEVFRLVKQVAHLGNISSMYRAHPAPTPELRAACASSLVDMLVAMQHSRAVLVKLADRLHDMRTLAALPPATRNRMAQETLDVWAPLANRVGLWNMKAPLEDLAFRQLRPGEYAELRERLEVQQRPETLVALVDRLRAELDREGIGYTDLSGRPKHLYGVWQKLHKKGYTLDKICDVRGLRIIVNSKEECYRAQRVVERIWPSLGRSKDYIRNKKPNGYQSLHTVVRADDGHELEVQIRTFKMHYMAEYGDSTAHWLYKEGPGAAKPGVSSVAKEASWAKFKVSQHVNDNKLRPSGSPPRDCVASCSFDSDGAEVDSPHAKFDPRFLKFLKRTGQLVQQPELRTMVAVLRNGGLDVHQLEPGTTLRDLLRVYGSQSLSQQQVVVNRQLETNAGAVLATGDIVDIYCEPEEPVQRPAAPGPMLPLRAAPAAGQQQQQPEVVVVLPRGVRSGVVPAAGLVGRLTARAAQQRAQA